MKNSDLRLKHLFLSGLLVLFVALVTANALKNRIEDENKLPDVFDFQNFKLIFRRQYKSLDESTVRQKIYLARAFRAFISLISYKHKKSSSYLAINQFSDWTTNEKKKLALTSEHVEFIQKLALDNEHPAKAGASLEETNDELTPGVELGELKKKLDEIKTKVSLESGFSEILEEWNDSAELIREPTKDTSSADSTIIETNNANYDPPELMSSSAVDGSEDVDMKDQLDDEEIEQINSASGSEYLTSLLSTFSSAFSSTQGDVDEEEEEELRKLSDVTAPVDRPLKHQLEENNNLPDIIKIDHRTATDCFFKPRDQGYCGSCYAFATIALYEWHHCKQTGDKIAFSEQYVVDCGRRVVKDGGLYGCEGGWPNLVSDFVQQFGIELRRNYPYKEKEKSCPYDENADTKTMGYLRAEDKGFKPVHLRYAEKELKEQPLLLTIAFFDSFYDYGGGVLMGEDCNQDKLHAVVLVGSGRQDGIDYWLVRNSYSPSWGEQGYFKLYKYSGCIKPEYAYALQIKFPDELKSNSFYDGKPIKRRLKGRKG